MEYISLESGDREKQKEKKRRFQFKNLIRLDVLHAQVSQ